MASATASNVIRGQSLKSHFMPIWVLALLISSFDFFKEQYLYKIKRLFNKAKNTWSCLFDTLTPINTRQIKESSLAYDKNANYSYVRYEGWNSTIVFTLMSRLLCKGKKNENMHNTSQDLPKIDNKFGHIFIIFISTLS